jgi:hypothetical protein
MRPSFSWLYLVLTAALVSGCGAHVVRAPGPPPPIEPQTRANEAAPARLKRDVPPLIAPPPAYGNKIVMAAGDRPAATN